MGDASGTEGGEERPAGFTDGAGGAAVGDAGVSSLVDSPKALIKRVFSVYRDNLWALIVTAGIPVAPMVLLVQPLDIAYARDALYVNGVLEPMGEPSGTVLWASGVALLLFFLASPIPMGATVLLGGAALLGRTIGVVDAWRTALRRYFATLTWQLLLVVFTAAVVAGAIGLALTDSTIWGIVPAVLIPVVVLLPTLAVMLPIALLGGVGPWRGLADAWKSGRGRREVHLWYVLASFGLVAVLGEGLERGLGATVGWGDGHPAMLLLRFLASVVLSPLVVLLICAPAVYDKEGRGTWSPLDLSRAAEAIPKSRETREAWAGQWRRRKGALVAVAILLPGILTPAVRWVDPFDTPVVAQSPVRSIEEEGEDERSVEVIAQGDIDGSPVLAVKDRSEGGPAIGVDECDPECGPLVRSDVEGRYVMAPSATFVNDGLMSVAWVERAWREEDYSALADSNLGLESPGPESGVRLWRCTDVFSCEDVDGVLLRVFQGSYWGTSTAVEPLEDGVVVASYVDDDERVTGGGLQAHVCRDAECEDPQTIRFPDELTASGEVGRSLDVTATPGGGFMIAAMDTAYGSLSLIACADAECAEPVVTEVFGDRFRTGAPLDRRLLGVEIEPRPGGAPVVAYRDVRDGTVHLLDCHDGACTDYEDRELTGPAWERPAPGLAVDSQGKPQLTDFDMENRRLRLISCLDGGCTDTERTHLSVPMDEGAPGFSRIALDRQDRPRIVWGSGSAGEDAEELVCSRPLCGVEPQKP
ncbi:transporter permease [Nocardiopsis suaedae]|uniref:ABC transporter permease n=1 Tax=Nocardiopsis suaedae TaxID=3018444 RepID=A0ABT4TGN2_9ACTN|nr:hypothetical protein [Nocardiopsis suaedae]MDA2803262.1 hypothetical protein [Nocardiopsis suaedae]